MLNFEKSELKTKQNYILKIIQIAVTDLYSNYNCDNLFMHLNWSHSIRTAILKLIKIYTL